MLLLKLGWRPFKAAPLSQIFSAVGVGLMLWMIGFLFWLDRSLSPVVARLQKEQVITAYIDPSYDESKDSVLMDTIRTNLGAKNIEVEAVSSSDFLNRIEGQYPDLARDLKTLDKELTYVVPRYISISGVLPKSAVEQVKGIKGVEQVDSSRDRHQPMIRAFSAIKWTSKLFIIGLLVALVTGLFHLSQVNGEIHRESVILLKNWGAGFISLHFPSLCSGLTVGVMGGGLAFFAWMIGGTYLASQVRSFSPLLSAMSLPPLQVGLVLLFLGSVIGLMTGFVGGGARSK